MPLTVEYDARLVEEAVLLRMCGHPEEARFRRGRDRIYEVADGEDREKQFSEYHAAWFRRLHLGQPLAAAFAEQPSLVLQSRRCCVAPAISPRDEGADLHETLCLQPEKTSGDRVVLIRLTPTRLLDPASLRPWLRHELTHIADMLDPRFGYEPRLPKSELGPAVDNLVRERYRVLWDTWIDGRLWRRGWAPEGVREKRWEEFATTFSSREPATEERFQQLFDSDSQTHAELVAFARNPATAIGRTRAGGPGGMVCPLCRFPSFHLLGSSVSLPPEAREEIAVDFPQWQPEQGICLQCADLYRARNLSRAAAAMLPGI